MKKTAILLAVLMVFSVCGFGAFAWDSEEELQLVYSEDFSSALSSTVWAQPGGTSRYSYIRIESGALKLGGTSISSGARTIHGVIGDQSEKLVSFNEGILEMDYKLSNENTTDNLNPTIYLNLFSEMKSEVAPTTGLDIELWALDNGSVRSRIYDKSNGVTLMAEDRTDITQDDLWGVNEWRKLRVSLKKDDVNKKLKLKLYVCKLNQETKAITETIPVSDSQGVSEWSIDYYNWAPKDENSWSDKTYSATVVEGTPDNELDGLVRLAFSSKTLAYIDNLKVFAPGEKPEPTEAQLMKAVYSQDFENVTARKGEWGLAGASKSHNTGIGDFDGIGEGNVLKIGNSNTAMTAALHGIVGEDSAEAINFNEGILEFDYYLTQPDGISPCLYLNLFPNLQENGTPNSGLEIDIWPIATANKVRLRMYDYSGGSKVTLVHEDMTGDTASFWGSNEWRKLRVSLEKDDANKKLKMKLYICKLDQTTRKVTEIIPVKSSAGVSEWSVGGEAWYNYDPQDVKAWSENSATATIGDGQDGELDGLICFAASSKTTSYIDNLKVYKAIESEEEKTTEIYAAEKEDGIVGTVAENWYITEDKLTAVDSTDYTPEEKTFLIAGYAEDGTLLGVKVYRSVLSAAGQRNRADETFENADYVKIFTLNSLSLWQPLQKAFVFPEIAE